MLPYRHRWTDVIRGVDAIFTAAKEKALKIVLNLLQSVV
jgi:hypothetical protein